MQHQLIVTKLEAYKLISNKIMSNKESTLTTLFTILTTVNVTSTIHRIVER